MFESVAKTYQANAIGVDGVKKVVDEGLWAETPEALLAAQDYAMMAEKGLLSETFGMFFRIY